MPVISVIVPVYNIESYLHQCVDSILRQTFKEFDLILVDDGSTDNSPLICDEYANIDARVKVIHKNNGGQGSARNVGINYALSNNSKYISFIDGDDYVSDDFLQILYDSLASNQVDVSVCYSISFSKEKDIIDSCSIDQPLIKYDVMNKDDFLAYISSSFYGVVPWNKLYKAELFKHVSFPIISSREDEYIAHNIFINVNKVLITNQRLYYYRTREKSTMSDSYSTTHIDNLIGALTDRLNVFLNNNVRYRPCYIQLLLRLWDFVAKALKQRNKAGYNEIFGKLIQFRDSSKMISIKILGFKWWILVRLFILMPIFFLNIYKKKMRISN